MENYIKAVLYAYPSLKDMEEAYAQHIKNQALLSCDGRMATERLAEYLAEEILRKRRLAWLKNVIDEALSRLSDLERALIRGCFFGERKKVILHPNQPLKDGVELSAWSERKRFRVQARSMEKLEVMLRNAGVTKKLFEEELLEIEVIHKLYKKVKGKSK